MTKYIKNVNISRWHTGILMMKLAVFDFDSTLMVGETLEYIAQEPLIQDEIKKITDEAMEGKLDFFESLTKRVALLKGTPYETVVKICENLPLNEGAHQAVSGLKKLGYKVVCFSGGFNIATIPAKNKLGLDAEFSNILHHKDGKLTGLVGGEMMFSTSKGCMIQKLQELLNISVEDTIAVGDGANDLSMFKYAATRIAFCAKPVVKEAANIIIDGCDLFEILEYIIE